MIEAIKLGEEPQDGVSAPEVEYHCED